MVDFKGFKFLSLKWIPVSEDKNIQVWMRKILLHSNNKLLLDYHISEESVWTAKGSKDKRQRNDVLIFKIWKG